MLTQEWLCLTLEGMNEADRNEALIYRGRSKQLTMREGAGDDGGARSVVTWGRTWRNSAGIFHADRRLCRSLTSPCCR